MRVPRKLPTRLRATAATLIGTLIAMLAGAAGALACSLPPPLDGQITSFRFVSGPGGDHFVSWSAYRRDGPPVERAAALRGGAWAWSEPGSVPAHDAQGLPWNAAVATAGGAGSDAVAVWQEGQAIVSASRRGAGAFGPPEILADETGAQAPFGGIWMDPTIDLGEGGHAVALWTRMLLEPATPEAPGLFQMVDRRVVRAADRAPDGTWSEPYDLAPPGAAREYILTSCGPWESEQPAVAVDAAGNAVAAWETWLPEPGQSRTMWSARSVGGAWSAPAVLTAGGGSAVRLAMDAAGTAHAVWVEAGSLRSARRPAGGAFGLSEVIGPAGGGIVRLQVDAAGRSVAVWQSSLVRILAATRPAGGDWSAPVDLSALEKPPTPPDEIGIVDRFLPEPPLLQRVRISRQEMRQPICALRRDGRARRACRSAGAALTFSLTSLGEVRVTVQRRGRGKALRGLRIAAGAGSHRVVIGARPLPPGRYTVRVRVTAEGRAPETAAKQLVVRPA